MKLSTIKIFLKVSLSLFVIIGMVTFNACKDDDDDTPPPDPCPDYTGAPTKASEWVSYVDWNNATRVDLKAEEIDENNMHYTPSTLQFTAGKPYILTISMNPGNEEKHYFHAPEFFKAIATRKVQTTNAEYKAPYFDDNELVLNGELELYFVPVIAGNYELFCTIIGHKDAGMKMTVDIVCGSGLSLDLEVDPSFNTALDSDDRRSGDNPVWDTKQEVVIKMVEINSDPGNEDFVFDPDTLNLSVGQAYVLKIENSATNSSKHYFTAKDFFQTLVICKAEDSKAEIKVPYFKAVEILIGGSSELFVVPTIAGTYSFECTITGHKDAGKVGTIIVQ